MTQLTLTLRDISKSFGGVEVLHQVNLNAVGGEVLALLGENGAGKSTLVKILAGDYTPDGITLDAEGAIWVAAFANNAFVRVREGGAITDVISSGERRAVACTLGGADLKTLYCLTFAGEMKDIGKGLRASRIETTRVVVAGAGSP